MKAKLLLRIASGLLIFHLMGHTYGHLNWRKANEPEKKEVINQMTGHQFPFMGSVRSMGDYFEGYGWACSIALILMAAILWLVAGSLTESKTLSSKILITLSICLFAWCTVEFLFFFPFAAGTTLLAGIFTLAATVQLQNHKA